MTTPPRPCRFYIAPQPLHSNINMCGFWGRVSAAAVWVRLLTVALVVFFPTFFVLFCSFIRSAGTKRKKKLVRLSWLQCHFVRDMFSFLSEQIIFNASANWLKVGKFGTQHDSFSANVPLWENTTLESHLFSRFNTRACKVRSAFPARRETKGI